MGEWHSGWFGPKLWDSESIFCHGNEIESIYLTLDQRINIQTSAAQNESSIPKIKSRHSPNAEAEM